jgi:hypothetical protein
LDKLYLHYRGHLNPDAKGQLPTDEDVGAQYFAKMFEAIHSTIKPLTFFRALGVAHSQNPKSG